MYSVRKEQRCLAASKYDKASNGVEFISLDAMDITEFIEEVKDEDRVLIFGSVFDSAVPSSYAKEPIGLNFTSLGISFINAPKYFRAFPVWE
jgi:hypothetical protein